MTTDAPPEKMMDAQIANEAENLARDHDNEFPITARILREAARRLCAPRVAIELTPAEIQSGLDRVRWAEALIRQLPDDHDGRNSWLLNYGANTATAAPRVGDGWTGRKCPRCNGFGQDDEAHSCKACGGTGEEYGPLDAALSAPPAASADAREDDTDNMVCYWCGKPDAELQGDDCLDDGPGGAWFVQCRECHATGPIMQTEPEALTAWKSGPGYRKRAPAQSVGQSAAQGVGDWDGSGNYVADRETKPREVRFANGMTVRLVESAGGDPFLDVLRDDASVRPTAAAPRVGGAHRHEPHRSLRAWL